MTLQALPEQGLLSCCQCKAWANALSREKHESWAGLQEVARSIWWQQVPIAAWYEAFEAHPPLGQKFTAGSSDAFRTQSAGEQAGIQAADEVTLKQLMEWNEKYQTKFGHVFLLCAAGASAGQVLTAIKLRYNNTPLAELKEAAMQQMLITEQRLAKLWSQVGGSVAEPESNAGDGRSPITCHVLDTSSGKPACALPITLSMMAAQSSPTDGLWQTLAQGQTNDDGRVPGLLPPGSLTPGLYRVRFDTEAYSTSDAGGRPFYPQPCIDFTVSEETKDQHFHIPLLLSPYAYSTYRGS